jgi:hypothetical protein
MCEQRERMEREEGWKEKKDGKRKRMEREEGWKERKRKIHYHIPMDTAEWL